MCRNFKYPYISLMNYTINLYGECQDCPPQYCPLGGNPEVGNPEYISYQDCPPQLYIIHIIYIICTPFYCDANLSFVYV